MDKPRTKRPVSVDKASRLLGISPEAVRKRYQREKLKGYKDESGRLFVYVEDNVHDRQDNVHDNVQDKQDSSQAIIDAYKSRDELYEKTISIMEDTIATLTRELDAKQLELEWKDTLFLKAMGERDTELKRIKQLLEPKPSFFRRLLSGRTDK